MVSRKDLKDYQIFEVKELSAENISDIQKMSEALKISNNIAIHSKI